MISLPCWKRVQYSNELFSSESFVSIKGSVLDKVTETEVH